MLTPTIATIPQPTCSTTDCTYSGTEFYLYEGLKLCGHCADLEDEAAMPPVPISYSRKVAA